MNSHPVNDFLPTGVAQRPRMDDAGEDEFDMSKFSAIRKSHNEELERLEKEYENRQLAIQNELRRGSNTFFEEFQTGMQKFYTNLVQTFNATIEDQVKLRMQEERLHNELLNKKKEVEHRYHHETSKIVLSSSHGSRQTKTSMQRPSGPISRTSSMPNPVTTVSPAATPSSAQKASLSHMSNGTAPLPSWSQSAQMAMLNMQRQYIPPPSQHHPTPQDLIVPSQRKQLPTEPYPEQLRHSHSRSMDSRSEQRSVDPRYADSRQNDPRYHEPRAANRSVDHRATEHPPHESRHVERRPVDYAPAEHRQSEIRNIDHNRAEQRHSEQRQPEHRHIEPRPSEPRPSRPSDASLPANLPGSHEARPLQPMPLEVLRSQSLQTEGRISNNAITDARPLPSQQAENRSSQPLQGETRRHQHELSMSTVNEPTVNESRSVQQRVIDLQPSQHVPIERDSGKTDEPAAGTTQKLSTGNLQGDAERNLGSTEPTPRSEAKRKATEQPSSSNPKRSRTEDIAADEGQDAAHASAKRSPRAQRSTQPVVDRTISFAEVYQNGEAQFKHKIFEFKPGSGNWYIARCDEHGVHFGFGNPVHGAAKHVHSPQHGNLEKKHELAIEICGHRIPDCTAELAELNNRVFESALNNGYKVFNKNLLTKEGRRRLTGSGPLEIQTSPDTPVKKTVKQAALPPPTPPPPTPPLPPPQNKPSDSALVPEACKFYQGLWQPTKKLYMLIVLPIEPGGSLRSVGLKENLQETDLIHNVPKCYRVDRLSFQIKGWQPAYEDGGPKVAKREYPVMYFDNYQKHSLGWLTAAKLSPVDLDNPPEGVDKRGLFVAREWYAQHMMHRRSWEDFKKLGPGEPPSATESSGDGERNDSWPSLRSAHTDDQSPIRDKSSGPGMFGSSSEGGSDDEDPMTMDIGPIPEPADSNYVGESEVENSDVEMRDASGADDSDQYRAAQFGRRTSAARQRGVRAHSQKKSIDEKTHKRHSSTASKKKGAQSLQQPKEKESMPEEYKSGLPTPATTDGGDGRELNVTPTESEDLRKSAQAKAAAAVMEAASRSRASSEIPENQTQTASSSRVSSVDHQRSRSEDNSRSQASKLNESFKPSDSNDTQNADQAPSCNAPETTKNDFDPYRRVDAIRAEMNGLKSRSASVPGNETNQTESPFAPPPPPPLETGQTQEVANQKSPSTLDTLSPPSQPSTLVPRSSSSTPVPGTGLGRDTPTPRMLVPGNTDKWQAVRATPGTPKEDAQEQVQTPVPNESKETKTGDVTAEIRNESPPQRGVAPMSERQEFFDIAHFRDSVRRVRWTRDDAETPYVRLYTDPKGRWAETNGSAPFTAAVEPLQIARLEVEMLEGQQQKVQVWLKNGGEQTLTFETNSAIGRSQDAALQARKFANWVKNTNENVELRHGDRKSVSTTDGQH